MTGLHTGHQRFDNYVLRFIERIGGEPVAYRVEELAAAAGVSVELLRSYQTKGLVDPPRRDGRVAL